MKPSLILIALAAVLITSSAAFAQAPAAAPSGSTGLCKDGSYTTNETKKGACSGHKGVKDWYGATAAAPEISAAASSATAAPTSKAMPEAATKTAAKAPSTTPAAGGGPGQVWVNTATKVYHCQGTRYYGKTKKGEYMTEAAAKAAGDRPDHGKACS